MIKTCFKFEIMAPYMYFNYDIDEKEISLNVLKKKLKD